MFFETLRKYLEEVISRLVVPVHPSSKVIAAQNGTVR